MQRPSREAFNDDAVIFLVIVILGMALAAGYVLRSGYVLRTRPPGSGDEFWGRRVGPANRVECLPRVEFLPCDECMYDATNPSACLHDGERWRRAPIPALAVGAGFLYYDGVTLAVDAGL